MTKLDKILIVVTNGIIAVSIIVFTVALCIKQNPPKPNTDQTAVEMDTDTSTNTDDSTVEDTVTDDSNVSEDVKEFGVSEDTVLRSKAYRDIVDRYMWFMMSEPVLYDVIKQENRSVFIYRYSFSHAEFRIVAKHKNGKVKCVAKDLINHIDSSYPILYWDMGSIPEDFMRVYEKAAAMGYVGIYRCDATNMSNVVLQDSNTDYVTLDCSTP